MILEWTARVIWSLVTSASRFTHKTQVSRNDPAWSTISVKSIELNYPPSFVVQKTEPRASRMLGKCVTTELHLQDKADDFLARVKPSL